MAVDKCSYCIFSRAKALESINIQLYGHFINYEKNPKFLGVSFDPRLTFNVHIANLKKKISSRLSILKFLSNKSWRLSKKLLKSIYFALVRSIIDYISFAACTISQSQFKILQTIQNKAITIIFKPPFRTRRLHSFLESLDNQSTTSI